MNRYECAEGDGPAALEELDYAASRWARATEYGMIV